jgi:hypothetical protein
MPMPIRALAASFQREPDLQRDLIPVHLSTIYVTPNLPHLEPAKVPQRARCLGYRVLNRFRDALLRSSDNVHNLVDWIGHLHSPLMFLPSCGRTILLLFGGAETAGLPPACGDGVARTPMVQDHSAARYVMTQALVGMDGDTRRTPMLQIWSRP